jgi:hypothetical protein
VILFTLDLSDSTQIDPIIDRVSNMVVLSIGTT